MTDDMREMKRAYRLIDTDQDGRISKEEMRNFLVEQTDEENRASYDQYFNSMDINGDGEISYTEFIATGMSKTVLLADKQTDAAFKYLDINSAGFLDKEKLKVIFRTNGASAVAPNMDYLWDTFIAPHASEAGKINYAEFKVIMNQAYDKWVSIIAVKRKL